MASSNRRPGTAPALAVSPVAGALNCEWHRDYECRLVPSPLEWRTDDRLAPFRRVVQVLAALEDAGTSPTRVEEMLCTLTERAAMGDCQAVRVVLQYLLPCLVRVSLFRSGFDRRSREEILDDLLSMAWEVIGTGVDLRGRPAKIALLRTIEYRALHQPARAARRRAAREVLVAEAAGEWGTPGSAAEPSAGESVLRVLADASRERLFKSDARLLAALFVGGATCEQLGAVDGVTARAVRYRRAAAVQRLVEWAA